MNNLVSIIIPVYNSKIFVKDTIDSILKQTYTNFEIIIIDDCSTDGTFKFLKNLKIKNKKIRLYKTKKNSGTVAAPRNFGIKKAKGNIICFTDSDDLWEKDKLEKQLNLFKNKKTIISTSAKYFSRENFKSSFLLNLIRKIIQIFIIKKVNSKGFQWFYIYNPIIVSSVMLHKNAFKSNQFDENVNSREDIDMWIRLRKQNYKFLLVNSILVSIRRRQKSLSSDNKKELVTIIRSLSNVYFKINNFNKLNFFLIGIFIKFFLTFIKQNKNKINYYIKSFSIIFVTFFFIFLYTPFFWYLGKPLLFYDNFKSENESKNIVVFSGHGSTSYYNITYQYRYKDIKSIINKFNKNNIQNIFILGRVQEIPEQKILEALLVNDGFSRDKIHLIYKDYKNTANNIKNIYEILKEKNVNKIIFVTSPYHSKRAKLMWRSFEDLEIKFWKGYEWPTKNNLFEYSKNKKIIIYEHASIFYNKIIGNIN